jgi:cell division septal protein FtsQ
MVGAHQSRSASGPVRDSLASRRRRRARRTLVAYAVAAVLAYGGIWHLARHPAFAIQEVTVEGNVVTPRERVAAVARASLASPALSLLPMTNAYLTRDGRVEEAVEDALPEVAKASVERRGQTLAVRVEERARFGYWCRAADDCYAVDADGLIFAREAPPEGATRFGGLVAAADPIRARYAPEEPWANLRVVIEAVRARGYSPARVSSEDGVDFTIELAEGPRLTVDATHPGAQAIENLQIALDDGSLAALAAYEYADLRLPHKVFLRAVAAGEAAE